MSRQTSASISVIFPTTLPCPERHDRCGWDAVEGSRRGIHLMRSHPIGIDFGTTNSSIARTDAAGQVQLAQFPFAGSLVESYRSLLYLDHVKERGSSRIKSWSGPAAIEE